MKDSEFLRVIEEVCLTLKLTRPCITQVLTFYRRFQASETHSYKIEIVIVACIYLTCKINEQIRKIRDILNIAYIVTTFYKKRNKELAEKDPENFKDKITYVALDHIKAEITKDKEGNDIVEEGISDWFIINNVPSFSLEKYNSLRDEVLEAEQHLLRILNYDLENRFEAYYQLLFKVLESQDFPSEISEKALAVYNDSFFLSELSDIKEDWRVLFSIYFIYGLVPTLSSDYHHLKDFEKKLTEKLKDDQQCRQAFEKFSSAILDYYDEIEKLP